MINPHNRIFFKCLRLQKFVFPIRNHRSETTSVTKSKVTQELFEKKIRFYMKVYEDIFGISKLTEMQNRITDVQIQLQNVQEERRHAQEEVFIIQNKLEEEQKLLLSTPFMDKEYISKGTQVRELLDEQKHLKDVLSLYDQKEREHQAALSLAIINSQGHERSYREKNKYLSLITGITGALLGLVGSSINNWRHKKDIKLFASVISDQVIDLKQSVDELQLAAVPGASLNTSLRDNAETSELQSMLKSQHDETLVKINSLKSALKDGAVHQVPSSDYSDEHVKDTFSEFEENIDAKLKTYTYVNLITSCVLCTVLVFAYIAKSN